MLAMVGVLLMAGACGGGPVIPGVAIGAADYSFTAPDSIAGGLVRVAMTNTGKEGHHTQFARLNDGVTLQQFQAALPKGEAAAIPLITFQGGSPPIEAGGKTDGVMDLPAGQYVLLCFIPSPDGVPHLAKGMVKPLTVTAAPAKRPAKPAVKGTVELVDFAFATLPDSITTGKATLAVANKGKEPHEMVVVKAKGVPAAQLQPILSQIVGAPPGSPAPSGPPPFEWAGGFQVIMPGATGWATLDLRAGEYALVCFVPSPASQGKRHLALGMFRPFTVK
jgi:hypothetical protein